MELNAERRKMLGKGTTNCSLDKLKKILNIELQGQFNKKTAIEFFQKFNECKKHINPRDYDLYVDCKYLGVFQVDLIDDLKTAFKTYGEFNSVTMKNPINSIGKMQLYRIAKEEKDFCIKFVE